MRLVVRLSLLALIASFFLCDGFSDKQAIAQEAEWIWSPEHKKDNVPRGPCHFRRSFRLNTPEKGQITIAADDSYDLYVNGKKVGSGESARRLDRYNISPHLRSGRNIIAVRVANQNGATAALVARVHVKQRGSGWQSFSTNKSWRTNLRPLPLWNLPVYNDSGWKLSQSFGMLGQTEPWDRAKGVEPTQQENHERFRIANEFQVQRVLGDEECGSLIAMTFNEFGQILASREGGPLVLIIDSDRDLLPDKVRVYCKEVTSCQGILALNGEVFVTGEGPDGNALYRLIDRNRDGKVETVRTLLKFRGPLGEHGPHGLTLGPDGMIYVVIGNHSAPQQEYDPASPHQNFYEGDIVPRYEDPGGHAVEVKAPGGVIIRTDIEGKKIELVAGGLRNAYDLAFNDRGDLFTHDSDMESDIGMTWYRPTQVYQVVPGGEYGWRSGWAKWPDYFVDNLPAIADTGRGSPTGAVVYNHHMFPKRFHGALFLGDWSEGRILAVRTTPSGGSYKADTEVFVEGQPLNVTDLEVGPDGAIYFITGGRDTSGGLYRISWRGTVPDGIKNLGKGMTTVIRQPQLQSAWSRQKIAAIKIELGDKWDKTIIGVAATQANPSHYRTRALDVMQLFGPLPSEQLLVQLSSDQNESVRAKAAELMGLRSSPTLTDALLGMLDDSDRSVRRKACESLLRKGESASIDQLTPLLTSDDRYESWAARRLLERTPIDQWREAVMSTKDQRLFIQGATALLIVQPTKLNASDVLVRVSNQMNGFISDRDFVDILRVAQLAYHRGQIQPNDLPTLRDQIAEEFPSGNSQMNRELSRLLGYLQVDSITDRYIEYLNSPDVPDIDKLHVAMHVRFVNSGWTSDQRIEMLRYFTRAIELEGGGSYEHYVMNASRDFAKSIDEEDVMLVLGNGAQWPHAALGVLYKLPAKLDGTMLKQIKLLDRQLQGREDDATRQLQIGIVAVLARNADDQSMEYLREIWVRDPERRETVAMGLAQHPDGENWDYLLRTLPVLDGDMAPMVLKQLKRVNLRPEEAEYYRQVILKGLTLKEEGAPMAIALLEHWTGQRMSAEHDSWKTALAAWKQWYANKYPQAPPAELPVASDESKWDYDELLEYLSGEDGAGGSAERGLAVFEKAQCVKCHRFGSRGESLGPDLTSISKRFARKEILQSIVYPSHIISDQYAAKTIITVDGKQYTGIVAQGVDGDKFVLGTDGKKRIIAEDDIDEIVPSRKSAMPDGLVNDLTLPEIADLFAYLGVAPKLNLANKKSNSVK